MSQPEIQLTVDNTDQKQAREICRDITLALLEKAGVQGDFKDKTQFSQITDTAIEMTRKITEAFKVRP